MSVQAGPTFKRYVANGVATVYAIPFLLLDAADLQITLNGVAVTTGFTLSGINNPTSSCTFTVAPTGDLLFQQVMTFQRLADYQINGDFLAPTVNRDYDRLWLAIKQLNRDSNRALTVSLLEPEGIPPLPVKALRALKVLAFDANGEPVTSTLTLAQLEQQPTLALESAAQAAASAEAAGDSEVAADLFADAAAAAAAAAAASAQSVAYAAMQLGMSTWGYRAQPFQGFALDDGQELDRSVYPDFAAALDAGLFPTVTQAQWNADPANRACFVAVSSAGKFRMRDLNGASVGSLGATFLRGGTSAGAGVIRQDQMQGHAHREAVGVNGSGANSSSTDVTFDAGLSSGGTVQLRQTVGTGTNDVSIKGAISDGVNGTPRVGSETFPTHATGAWMTRLFGIVTPLGSAEAASLATSYASLASRITALESSYMSANQTWSNGGTVTQSHGLSVRPFRTSVEAECVTADVGYSVGAVIDLGASQCLISGANNYGFTTEASATQVIMNIAAQGLAVANKSTRAVVAITPGSWRLRLKASKF